jgi:PTS system nitrogen regulatory IIA component
MTLVDVLVAEHVYIDPPWSSFEEAVGAMVAAIGRTGSLDPRACEVATQALLARERASSTAIPEIGLAIPHARLGGIEAPVAALAVGADGIYDVAPSLPIRIVALVVSPERATDAHLQLLAGVAMRLRSPGLRTALLRATDAREALAALGAGG